MHDDEIILTPEGWHDRRPRLCGTDTLALILILDQARQWREQLEQPYTCYRCDGERAQDDECCPHCGADAVPF